MNHLTERDIERLLTPTDATPPADLAARIKAAIPADLGIDLGTGFDDGIDGEPQSPTARPRRWLLPLAATLIAAVGATLITVQLQRDPPRLSSTASSDAPTSGVGMRVPVEPEAPQPLPETVGDEVVFDALAEIPAAKEDNDSSTTRQQAAAEMERRRNELRAPYRALPPDASPQRSAAAPKRDLEVWNADGVEISDGDAIGSSPTHHNFEDMKQESVKTKTTSQSPLLDASKISTGPTISQTELEKIPASRAAPSRQQRRVTGSASAGRTQEIPKPATTQRANVASQEHAGQESLDQRREAKQRELAALGYLDRQLEEAEPAIATPDAMFVCDYGTNPFVATAEDALSTFALDVDTGSYNLVRRYLRDGNLPPAGAVRVEELINAFDYRDLAPRGRNDFALGAEAAPTPFDDSGRYLLRFNVHAREIDDARRAPADLVFVVDTSGSMAREDRIELVKRALYLLLDELRPDDRVALVTYGSRGRLEVPMTGDREQVRRVLAQLQAGGSTNAEEGLVLGYGEAERARRRGAISRIILTSDGVANVGATGPAAILDRVAEAAAAGIELTTVGVGMGNYNDVLMEQLADRGNGRYAYVDELDEARKIFVEGLTGTLQTIAAETKVQVAFDPEVVARYRLIGYENRDVADQDFRNDAVDAGEIGAGHTATALYEIELTPQYRDHLERAKRIATLTLRYGSVSKKRMVEQTQEVRPADFVSTWDEASPALRLTALIAEFGEILRGNPTAADGDLQLVLKELYRVAGHYTDDPAIADLVSLVARAAELRRR